MPFSSSEQPPLTHFDRDKCANLFTTAEFSLHSTSSNTGGYIASPPKNPFYFLGGEAFIAAAVCALAAKLPDKTFPPFDLAAELWMREAATVDIFELDLPLDIRLPSD